MFRFLALFTSLIIATMPSTVPHVVGAIMETRGELLNYIVESSSLNIHLRVETTLLIETLQLLTAKPSSSIKLFTWLMGMCCKSNLL